MFSNRVPPPSAGAEKSGNVNQNVLGKSLDGEEDHGDKDDEQILSLSTLRPAMEITMTRWVMTTTPGVS